MLDFVETYWMQGLWTVLLSAATWFIRKMANELKSGKAEQEAIKDAVLSLSHDRIYAIFQRSIARHKRTGKGLTLEERRNLEYLFKSYENLGGNGTGRELYERCMALPVEEKEEEL